MRALIIDIRVLLSRRCLILFMRRCLYRQVEDNLDMWSSKVMAESIQTPISFTIGGGSMFFPSRRTGGKDRFGVSCGTPPTRSVVLSALINKEFVEHRFATSRRSLVRSERKSQK